MKRLILVASLVVAAFSVKAQQKNILLQADFWKQSPNVESVKAEIAKGNDPTALDSRSMDPAVFAINNNAPLETILFLLSQNGNNINKITHDSRIYLHWAAMRGNVPLVEHLIAKGSDLRAQDSHGSEPIVFAISGGQKNTALYDVFLKSGIDVKAKYKAGANLLLLGVANDSDLSISNYLISKGLSLKDIDKDGNTAFDYAAKSGNISLLKSLISKGVAPTNNALIFASQGGRGTSSSIEVYKYLVEDVKLKPTAPSKLGVNVLHQIVRKPNQEEIINYFLTKGVDVNQGDEEGNTPFLIAAGGKNLKAIELLTSKVKNINTVNMKGESALTTAVSTSSPEVVAYLLSKGADVNVLDRAGNNLAYHLVQNFKPAAGTQAQALEEFNEKLNLLMAGGVNVAAAQKDGNTLYHIAVAKADLSLLKRLAELKIDVNAKNKEGLTVLHRAALISKDDEILKYLVSIGANKALKTEFDETAYDLASENDFLSKKNIAITFLK